MDIIELREELENLLLELLPDFELYVASSGEIVISTGLCEDSDGELETFVPEEDSEEDPDVDPELEDVDELELDEE
jgi:hypothetical protein